MTDTRLPPTERMPAEGQTKKPTWFGLLVVSAIFAFAGYILGIALLGLIDLSNEKFRLDLRWDMKMLRPYFGYGGVVVGFVLGMIFTFLPERTSGEKKPESSPTLTDRKRQEERRT